MLIWAFFGLWETTLLAGAGAVSVPIVIHLLNRRRFRIVTWAAMRFLLAAQRQNTRRLRLEQLLLLLVRSALVLLVVLAMASVMPWAENVWAYFWPDGPSTTSSRHARTHHVLVLDGSLSMNVLGDNGTAFDQARRLAIQKVKSASAGDGFTVLLMKENPAWIVAEVSQDARKVAVELESVFPTHGNASVPATLGMVAAKLGEASGRFHRQVVYLFTDLQRATWTQVPTPQPGKDKNVLDDIGQKASLVLVDVGRDNVGNLAVSDVAIDVPFVTTGMLVGVTATVQNFGTEPRKNVRVEMLAGRAKEAAGDDSVSLKVIGQELKDIAPGERKTITFPYRFTNPGSYAVQVRLNNDGLASDALDSDDARTVVVAVKETVPLLLVNGKPAPDRFDQASEYLRLALNPFSRGAEPKFAPLRPHVVSSAQFAEVPEDQLASYDAIFLCDVGQIGFAERRRLELFLRLGGGVIVGVGDQVADNLEVFNRVLYRDGDGLLPAKLFKKVAAPAEHYFSLYAQEGAYQTPPLKEFAADDDRIALRSSRFRQYLQAKIGDDPKVRTILTFMPEVQPLAKVDIDKSLAVDDPALLEWNPPVQKAEGEPRQPRRSALAGSTRYRGKVILLTTTFNMDWNSWPGSPSYGAMMQEITRLAVAGKLRENALLVGAAIEEFFSTGGVEIDVDLAAPNPKDLSHRHGRAEGNVDVLKRLGPPRRLRTQTHGEVSVFRWTDTDLSGIYVLTSKNDAREFLYAVNFPAATSDHRDAESDLTRLPVDKLQEYFADQQVQVVANPDQAQVRVVPGAAEDVIEMRAPVGPSIAHVLLLGVLVLLVLEVVLAWQFGHYSTVEGSTGPPALGKLWPTSVALAAAAFFAAIAFVLIDAARTGDFLGFMPEAFRGWVERALNVPPAPPGEGTRWELEYMPYFGAAASNVWTIGSIALTLLALVFLVYRAEGPTVRPAYKLLLGALRGFLILFALVVLLPQLQLRFDRQGWPDIVLLFDDSRSMGESDVFQDDRVRERVKALAGQTQQQVKQHWPAKIAALEAELARLEALDSKQDDAVHKAEVARARQRLQERRMQLDQANSPSWKPSRLQLAQALVAQPDLDWLQYLVFQRRTKVHAYHLDAEGRAIRLTDAAGGPSEITDHADPQQLEKCHQAIAALEAEGSESRLGTALRQVIDHYRGASLSAIIMFTDGVTTRDETIAQASLYAAQKGVPLFFVGIGDDHDVRDLKLHDLQVEDVVYVNDIINFEARLTGQGYKDLTLPVILKVKGKDGKETELARTVVKVDPLGRSVRVRLRHQAKEVGRKTFVIEAEFPKGTPPDNMPPPSNLRLERAIDIMDAKLIRVLYVEGSPRYEFRFLKALLERESPDDKKNRSLELKVVLLDADADFPAQDRTALADFPATREELEQYDVIILGDVNPHHEKLKEDRLRLLADFVRGEDRQGKKTGRAGGGLLFIAGTNFSPHAFRGTPLADVLPVEPNAKAPPEPEERTNRYRLELTPIGKLHPIFRFSPDEFENQKIWQQLAPMFWWSAGYRIKPLAEVLAVHPTEKALALEPGQDPRHPLVVQQFVGSGRTMFFGFDESWRWRFREDEIRFNKFWIQTIRYLSRTRQTRTELRLDRQTPYRVGEPIKVTVRFPDSLPFAGGPQPGKGDAKGEVKVVVEYRPAKGDANAQPEIQTMSLERIEGSTTVGPGAYEGMLSRTREGKYRFWLSIPDVSKQQPGGERPSAEAVVELPPGELEKLRLNHTELADAADATQGRFYTLAAADQLLEELPSGARVSLSTPRPPLILWNHVACFLLVMGLLTAEWILRKRKHLL